MVTDALVFLRLWDVKMKKLTEKEKFEAGKAQMYQYLDSQYLAWHIVAVESIKKLILNLDDFYSDITGENQPLSIVEHEQIKNEVRIGWIFEALSHAEQAIEDLFSFLMLSKNIDTFVKNVVNYNATDVKRYIWNFKTNDPSKFLGEFFLPYFDLDDSLTWADHQDCYIEYRIAVLRMQTYFSSKKESILVEGLQEGKIFLKYTGETALYILENVPGAMQYIKARYSHIIIDEYQDCGEIQDKVFIKLVESGLTGIAVGDINQAIYGFTKRFPKYLIALMKRDDFARFELSKNHRCHPSISEYSLCLFGASKTVPREKRVFKVDISGDERNIAAAIDKYLNQIKDKYGIVRNNQVAILCRSNSTAFKVGENLSTPYKIFEETVLDRDNSEWGRFFRDLLSASFDESVFAVDYAEQLFSEELEPQKYRKALALCQSIFSNSFDDFCNAEDKIKELAGLVYAQKETKVALNNLHSVIRDPHQLKNYVPARENELNIMTLHKSKGLEFNIVFHMDMYKWIIPNEFGDESSVQQDLNLHYVGLTRAKDACYIMNGTARFRSKKNDYIFAEPSLFLSKPGLAERRKDVRWEM